MLSLLLGLLSGRNDFKLVVRMVGVKMGDRLLQVGCPNGPRLGAVAAGVGLSGRAVAVVQDSSAAQRATKGAAQAGVLVEIEQASPTHLPLEDGSFDVAVFDDTNGLLAMMSAEDRRAAVRELLRVLRAGGRVMVISTSPRAGFGTMVSRTQSSPPFDPGPALKTGGFNVPRTLAEREGLVFVEALKGLQGQSPDAAT